jgi:hypothetical protein
MNINIRKIEKNKWLVKKANQTWIEEQAPQFMDNKAYVYAVGEEVDGKVVRNYDYEKSFVVREQEKGKVSFFCNFAGEKDDIHYIECSDRLYGAIIQKVKKHGRCLVHFGYRFIMVDGERYRVSFTPHIWEVK